MRLLAALLLVLTLALAGCGGDDDEDSSSTAGGRDAATTATETTDRTSARNPERDAKQGGAQGSEQDGSPASGREPSRPAPESPEAKPIRATLATFFDGMGARNGKQVCGTFSRQLRDLVGSALGSDCAGGMDYAFGLIIPKNLKGAFSRVRVRRVAVNGDRARAKLRLPKKIGAIPTLQFVARKDTVSLRRENGAWKLGLPAL